jgi:hypothetical protein
METYFTGITNISDPDAAAYIAALPVPPPAMRQAYINDLVLGLKADGLWTKIDWLLLFAARTKGEVVVNLRKPSKVATLAAGDIGFNADLGVSPGLQGYYIDIGEAWNAPGNVYSQNSAFLLIDVLGGSAANPCGVGATNNTTAQIHSTNSGSAEDWAINGSVQSFTATANNVGMRIASRTTSTAGAYYLNGASVKTTGGTSVAPPTGHGTFFYNNGVANGSGNTYSCGASGSGLTATDALNLYNRLNTYITTLNLIP